MGDYFILSDRRGSNPRKSCNDSCFFVVLTTSNLFVNIITKSCCFCCKLVVVQSIYLPHNLSFGVQYVHPYMLYAK